MKLDPLLYSAVVAALHEHRVAKHAALLCGVNPVTAWRIAKKENIELISLSEHHRKRLADPEFRAVQIPAAREGASAWLKRMHRKPGFHRKTVEAARKNMKRLQKDPEFRLKAVEAARKSLQDRYGDPAFRAAAAKRLKKLYRDPDFRRKQAKAASKGMRRWHVRNRKKKAARDQAI